MARENHTMFTVTITDDENEEWSDAAKAAGLTRHAWVRAVCNHVSGFEVKNSELEKQLEKTPVKEGKK